jgi:hypothetical protein
MNTKTTSPEIIEIINVINDMTEGELIDLNNTYCQSANIHDSEIFDNDEETLQMFFGNDILRAIQATQYGDYSYHHKYIQFNGYGNLDSFDRITTDNLCEYPETIAEYIAENKYDFQHLFNGILG